MAKPDHDVRQPFPCLGKAALGRKPPHEPAGTRNGKGNGNRIHGEEQNTVHVGRALHGDGHGEARFPQGGEPDRRARGIADPLVVAPKCGYELRNRKGVPEHALVGHALRQQPHVDDAGQEMKLPVNEVRNALGHAVPRGPGKGGCVHMDGHPGEQARGRPCPCRGRRRKGVLGQPFPERPQDGRKGHASTSTARPISSLSEMSGNTMNTRPPMRMRSFGFRPRILTAQYGSSPITRISSPPHE